MTDSDSVVEGAEVVEDDDNATVVTLPEPDIKRSRFAWLTMYRHAKKRRKLAKKGYVQWYLIGDGWPAPKYVKPDYKGGGIPELKHNGERYLFPREAMLPSERQGMWTVIHRRGEADPLHLSDPSALSIPTDALEEYLSMRVTASKPSWWDSLNIDPQDAVMYAIAGVIVLAALNSFVGGF